MTKLILYVKTGCPYCAMVIHKMENLELQWEERNISNEEAVNQLIARGGKRQVPYLIDEDKKVEMYESSDIVSYLEENYGKNLEI